MTVNQVFGFFFFLNFIGLQLIYNVVLVSGIQQSDSVIHIHIVILYQILFSYRYHRIEFPVLYSRSLLVISGLCLIKVVYQIKISLEVLSAIHREQQNRFNKSLVLIGILFTLSFWIIFSAMTSEHVFNQSSRGK